MRRRVVIGGKRGGAAVEYDASRAAQIKRRRTGTRADERDVSGDLPAERTRARDGERGGVIVEPASGSEAGGLFETQFKASGTPRPSLWFVFQTGGRLKERSVIIRRDQKGDGVRILGA